MAGPNVQLLPWLKPSWLAKVAVVPHPEFPAHPCLVWLGGKSMDGYGLLRMQDGKMAYLHRRAWEEANGEKLGKERDGHHKCYNRPCFQPHHIEAQSRDDNRGATQFKAKCPVSDEELVALYDLNEYFYRKHGYALGNNVLAVC